MPSFCVHLLKELDAERLPPRRPRQNPRAVKRKMSNYSVKRPTHRHWPQPTRRAEDAVIILSP